MVQSQQLCTAQKVIRSLLQKGVAEREVHQLVSAIAVETGSANLALPIYDQLPDGMIDLPRAAKRYRRSTNTLHGWINGGRLRVVGRLRAPAAQGGYVVVIEADVARLNSTTLRRNR